MKLFVLNLDNDLVLGGRLRLRVEEIREDSVLVSFEEISRPVERTVKYIHDFDEADGPQDIDPRDIDPRGQPEPKPARASKGLKNFMRR